MKQQITKTGRASRLALALVCAIGSYDLSIAQENRIGPHPNAVNFQTEVDKSNLPAPLVTASFVEMGKPGTYPTITDMVTFNGKLILATSLDPLGGWGTSVYSTTDGVTYSKILSDANSQGYLRMGVYDSKLWIPDGDPNGLDPGYVYVSSTGAASSFTKTTILEAVHTFDVRKYNNKFVVSNGMGGTTANGQGGLCKYDGSTTWNLFYSSAAAFRMKYMVEFQGKLLVANSSNSSDVDYFMWNGDVETTSPTLKTATAAPGISGTFRWFASSKGKLFWTVTSSSAIRCLTSTDGTNWTTVAGLNGTFVSDYCELNGTMYALSENGLWESTDHVTFTKIATPPASDPNAFKPCTVSGGFNADGLASMEPYNGAIYCGSSTNGKVYKVTIATSTPEEQAQHLKLDIYPNPFVTSTTFQVAKSLENATLTVYSSLGQAVKVVKNLNGNSFTLDRNQLPQGLYYVQLSENNATIASNRIIITD